MDLGLVETSNNLASAAPTEDGTAYRLVQTTRSSITASLEAQRDVIGRLGRLAGATVKQSPHYPGWQPNPSSAIVQVCQSRLTMLHCSCKFMSA